MGISIFGDTSSDNYNAALALRPALEELIGERGDVRIVVGAFTPGCQVQDTDLLVLGVCTGVVPIPEELLAEELSSRPARLSNFAIAIEVKGHPPEAIRFEGNQVLVRYINRANGQVEWHGATDQNLKQVHSLKTYVERQGFRSPFWLSALWLRNVPARALPKVQSNILGADVTAKDFLRAIVNQRHEDIKRDLHKPWQNSFVRCGRDDAATEVKNAIDIFTRRIEASPLDRQKIERITKRTVEPELPEYMKKLGSQLLIFRGRGGSGKTVRLLQLANRLREDRGARVLFLTYNRALASDLRRLMHLMGIRENLDDPTVSIRTSERFFWELMSAWGEAPPIQEGEPFPAEEFQAKKLVLRELFAGESRETLQQEEAWKAHPSLFNWDFVLIDEAQDWPTEERDILGALFGPNRIIVADGVDQLVRRDGRCDWTLLAPTESRQIVPLRKSLRLKANICAFVEAFVAASHLEWDMAINDEVLGGRVIVVVGPYTQHVHSRIMGEHQAAGNRQVDALFCVTGSSGSTSTGIGATLQQWGEQVWDGSIAANRDTFPENVQQFRIVKYESCRGLEGWTVVCLDFDRLLQRQLEEGLRRPKDLFETQQEVADRFSARWGMIPMTRAIDTLVLQVSPHSNAAGVLTAIAKGRDYVEVIGG
ncbi:DNA or RNA helicase [Phycisphaerae bacterium]|nr:DNA or RNA helicase [Phycisphaerae bacterium]